MNKKILFILLLIFVGGNSFLFAQDCNITSKANDILPDKLCAPVSLTWTVTYRGVNDGGATVEIQADWDDGNAVEIQTATETDASNSEWQVTFSHTYPIGGNKCNYAPKAMLIVDGVLCTSSVQEQNVTVWDKDDSNGGIMEISPQEFDICVGNEDGTIFTDVSTWNCTPNGGENDNINGKTRWTQWIYGSSYTINNVSVGGSVRTYPDTAAVVEASEYVDEPQAPNNTSLFCNAPATAQVGEYFEVTLRNWNYCNPYDDPNIAGPPADTINGDFPPIITTARILIVDTPKTSIDPVDSFCENDPAVNLKGSPSGGVWNGNGITSTGSFRPWVAGAGVHTITYTTTDPTYGCDGMASVQITVFAVPKPDILPGATAEVCPGDILNLDGNPTAGDGNIISHLWTGDTVPLNATNIQTPTFKTDTQGLYNITYTVTDDNGCANSDIIAINVNPVHANIIPEPAEVCAGDNLILNGNPSGGTGNYITHVWTGDVSYLNATDKQSVTFNSNTPKTYKFIYNVTDDNGCNGSDSIIVTVFENPIANAGGNDSTCSLSIQLSAIPSVGNGTWSKLSGSGNITFDDNHKADAIATTDQYGLYQLIWEETNGPSCTDRDTISIRFTENPVADAGPNGGVCGYEYQLSANPSVGNGNWYVLSGAGNITFDDSTQSDSKITSDVYGDYNLVWQENNNYGCIDKDTVLISFNLVPTPAFTPIDSSGCTPFTVNFRNKSTGGTEYHWDFGNGNTTTQENPTETFYNPSNQDSTYHITLIVNNPGCGDTIIQSVTVHPLPIASFSDNGNAQCSPSIVDFSSTSSGSVMHLWNWDDGSQQDTADNISHTFINDTVFIITYNIKMIAVSSFGCTDTTNDYLTVFPSPNYDITATPDSVCQPANIDFSSLPGGQTYAWDFGNGTSLIGSHTAQSYYTNLSDKDSSYKIQLIVTSYFGCTDTASTQILVHPSPNVDFDISDASGCAPLNLNFTNTSTGGSTYIWDFGDGEIDTNLNNNIPYHYENNTANPITYYIKLSGENKYACKDELLKSILVYPKITADFVSDTAGCSPLSVYFKNQSFGANSYKWDFGNDYSSTDSDPNIIFNNTKIYNDTLSIQLIAISNYACSDTATRKLVIYPSPTASFDVDPNEQIYPNATFTLDNQSSYGIWQYKWDFGDNTTSSYEEPGSHTYSNWGEYDIWLKVYNNYCEDSTKRHIKIIRPLPIANFEFIPVEGCVPLKISLKNLSSNAENYYWEFGDGYTSEAYEPTHVYYDEGLYFIKLKATGENGSDEKTLGPVRVYPSPEAHFEVAPEVVFIPEQPIKCFNLSIGEDNVMWDFGDKETSTENNPLHYYKKEGKYTITLIASTKHMCRDTIRIEEAVEAKSEGKIDFPNAFKPNASGPNGGKYSIPDMNSIVFHPVYKGIDEYELNIFNRWGELIFVSKDINIGWDGYYKGKLCKQDVYVWKVQGKYISGEQFNMAGDLTLLR